MSEDVRLTRAEYWILESAVGCSMPLQTAVSPDIEMALNRQGHGLAREQFLDRLHHLLSRGWLELRDHNTPITLGRAVQYLESCRAPDMYRPAYALTTQGGAIWEAFAAPEWSQFANVYFEDLDSVDCEARTMVVEAAREHVGHRTLEMLASIGIHVEQTIERLVPFEATYWKTLPQGCRFRFKASTPIEISWGDLASSYTGLLRWYEWGGTA